MIVFAVMMRDRSLRVVRSAITDVIQSTVQQREHLLCGIRIRYPPVATHRHINGGRVRHNTATINSHPNKNLISK